MLPADNDARLAALLLAIDPATLKGAIVRGRSPMQNEMWLEMLQAMMPVAAPHLRVPPNISTERLLGGLDFAATLSRGASVSERGLLASAHSGTVVLQASTARSTTFAHVTRALDRGQVDVERDGLSESHVTSFAAIVLANDDDDAVPGALSDRVAFTVDLHEISAAAWNNVPSNELVAAAQSRLSAVRVLDDCIPGITRGAAKLGTTSLRAILLTLGAARAHAALLSHDVVSAEDLACAARLVLAPRATQRPDAEEDNANSAEAENDQSTDGRDNHQSLHEGNTAGSEQSDHAPSDPADSRETQENAANISDVVVRAATAALPAGLLAAAAARLPGTDKSAGRSGGETKAGVRGRQIGVRKGDLRGGARLDLVATLRAAVPFQRIRRSARTTGATRTVELRKEDFRVRRCATPTTTTTLFVVDASGSAALHRLAEAKGAVELMLAEGYARRDRVALIAFRGTVAELVLPATHALARARRAVAGMPAGGGTPLATALDVAAGVVLQLRKDTAHVVVVVLTDGRANVARDGKGGRARAEADATDAAKRLRSLNVDAVWIDTAARTELLSRQLADHAGARYVALPAPNARGLTDVARALGPHADVYPTVVPGTTRDPKRIEQRA